MDSPMTNKAIALLILAQAMTDMNFGLIEPFFPGVCLDRGISHLLVGAIFTTQPAFALFASPFVPRLCRRFGNHAVMFVVLIAEAGCNLLWATTGLLPTPAFLAASFALRATQGVLQGTFEASSTAMLYRIVPPRSIGSVMGYSEAGRALGFMLGPLLGGLLYEGGFAAPFLAFAALLLLLPLALLLSLRAHRHRRDSLLTAARSSAATPRAAVPLSRLLAIPGVVAGLLIETMVILSISAFSPLLQPFLAHPPLYFRPSAVGIFLALTVLAYVLAACLAGAIALRAGDVPTLAFALALAGASLLFTGPSPLLLDAFPSLPQFSLPLLLASFSLFGVGAGMAFAPASSLMTRAASAAGISTEEGGDEMGALSSACSSLGAAVGPLTGGLLAQRLGGPVAGMRWLNTALAFALLALMLVVPPLLRLAGPAPKPTATATVAPLVAPTAEPQPDAAGQIQ